MAQSTIGCKHDLILNLVNSSTRDDKDTLGDVIQSRNIVDSQIKLLHIVRLRFQDKIIETRFLEYAAQQNQYFLRCASFVYLSLLTSLHLFDIKNVFVQTWSQLLLSSTVAIILSVLHISSNCNFKAKKSQQLAAWEPYKSNGVLLFIFLAYLIIERIFYFMSNVMFGWLYVVINLMMIILFGILFEYLIIVNAICSLFLIITIGASTLTTLSMSDCLLLFVVILCCMYFAYIKEKNERMIFYCKCCILALEYSNDAAIKSRSTIRTEEKAEDKSINNADTDSYGGVASLTRYNKLPQWYKKVSSEFIVDGYRINYNFTQCVKSILTWHNETMNIATELVPCVLNIILNIYLYVSFDYWWINANIGIKLVSLMCFANPLRCLASGFAHTFYCMDEKINNICWKIDYCSIVIGLGFTTLADMYLIIFCHNVYIIVGLIIAWICILVCTFFTVITTNNAVLRELILTCFVFVSTHLVWMYHLYLSFKHGYPSEIWILWTIGLVFATVGALVRIIEFPEKWIKINKSKWFFDYLLGSHQIWHVFINVYSFLHILSCLRYVRFRTGDDTCHIYH